VWVPTSAIPSLPLPERALPRLPAIRRRKYSRAM
jgi:hypothetical protein